MSRFPNTNNPFDGLADVAELIVDDRTGIIKRVTEAPTQAGAPNFFYMYAQACNTTAFVRQKNFSNAGGAAITRDRALGKAIGEALERYSSAIFDVEDFPLFRFADAKVPCVSPEEFALYSEQQYVSSGFPWVPFTRKTPVRWVAARDLTSGEVTHVPACRVYMPYMYYLGTSDAPIDQPISTGLACHAGLQAATLSAICEVVERDAFTICWQAMLAPPRVRLETLDAEAYDLVERFERTSGEVDLFDLRVDHGIPTILATLRYKAPAAPALVVAAASSADPKECVRKSLEELAHTLRYSQWIKDHTPDLVFEPPYYETVSGQWQHLSFWARHENSPMANFLFASDRRIDFDSIVNISTGDAKGDIAVLVERIRSLGQRVLVCDISSADLHSLGLAVVRAIIPGFHPLHMGHRLRALGGRRLREVPAKLGFDRFALAVGDNPAPHPYP